MNKISAQAGRLFLLGLQERITSAVAALDGNSFVADAWEKHPASRSKAMA